MKYAEKIADEFFEANQTRFIGRGSIQDLVKRVLEDAAKACEEAKRDNDHDAIAQLGEHASPAWDRAYGEGCLTCRDDVRALADKEVP